MAGLTLDQLREVFNANRSRFRKGMIETQSQKDYPITRISMANAKSEAASHTLEWTLRRKAATGSISAVNPYENVEGVRDEYDCSLSVKPKHWISHKERVFSALATIFAKNSPEQLWKDFQSKQSSAEENWWRHWESQIYGVPNTADSKDAYLGWLYWLPRSMTSGGVFTEQIKPARNGVYVRLGDGTIVSTVAGQDRASAANARLRGLVFTHRNKVDEVMLNSIEDAVIESGYKYIAGLEGDRPGSEAMDIFWCEQWDRDYSRILNKRNSTTRRDLFDSSAKSIAGASTVPCEVLNNHFLSPIFGIRHSNMHLVKFDGNWGRDIETWDGSDKMGKFKGWSAQGRALEPSTCGFLGHGSFSTGT